MMLMYYINPHVMVYIYTNKRGRKKTLTIGIYPLTT